jgi:exodeoxyribonuclease-3
MSFPIDQVIKILEQDVKQYRTPVVDLVAAQTREPFKALVATILSARTRDEVTASACRRLFKQVNTAQDLKRLNKETIEKIIYPVGFYHNKARFLKALPLALERLFNGRIPDDVESLVKLPGVGRKTANLVVSVAFQKPAVCVDTHVHRIVNIWGYVNTKTPLETEMALRKKLPERYWITFNSILVAFGQQICKPVRPSCDKCVIASLCPRIKATLPVKNMRKNTKKGHARYRRFFSWNVNGLRALLKKGFMDIFYQLDADVLALQEIKATPDQLPEETIKIPGYKSYWFPAKKKGYSGTAFYSRLKPVNVMYGFGIDEFDSEGRVITLEFEDCYLVNAYFPNAQAELKRLDFKLRFNEALFTYMNALSGEKTTVVCGDFNVAHKPIDLANPNSNASNPGYSPAERAWMDKIINAGYIDTLRKFNREPGQYTWWSYRHRSREKNIGWRIDYFMVDPSSEKRVAGADIHNDILGSDHCPVRLDFC